jgi:transposase
MNLGEEPPDHAIGRSRGGLTSKLHLVCDGRGRALSIVITAGNVNDTGMLASVVGQIWVPRVGAGRPRSRPERVLADKGYPSRANRAWLASRSIKATIPDRTDQQQHRVARGSRGGRPPRFDADIYRKRNVVERCFNRLKNWRGIATRTDKLARNYHSGVCLAATLTWLNPRFTNTA